MCVSVCLSVCVHFYIYINSMSHYTVTLHALHNLSSSFTITFIFNNHKTVVEIHYNVDNNILISSLIINNIYIHSLRSVCLSVCVSAYLSHIVKRHCKSVKTVDLKNFTKYVNIYWRVFYLSSANCHLCFLCVLSFHSFGYVIFYTEMLSGL